MDMVLRPNLSTIGGLSVRSLLVGHRPGNADAAVRRQPGGSAGSTIAATSADSGTVAKPTRASLAPYGSHSAPSCTSAPQE